MAKLTISDVNQKHLKIVGYLVVTWGLAMGLVYVLKDPRFLGLAPVFNYLLYAIKLELKNEGYRAVK